MNTYAIDFESYYDDTLTIPKMGPIAYTLATDIYLVSVVGPGVEYVGPPEGAPWSTIAGHEWVSHNRTFDRACWLALTDEEVRQAYDPSRWHCTADMAAYLGVARSLLDASKVLLGVDVDKSTRAKMKGKRWPKDFDTDAQEEVRRYALDDSRLCLRLWTEHGHKFPEHQRRLSEHTTMMTHRGIYADTPKILEGIDRLSAELREIESRIPWAGRVNEKGKPIPITSPKALAEACREIGIHPPSSTAKDSVAFQIWLVEHGEQAPFAKAFGEWKSINRTLAELTKFRDYTVDGRIRYDLKYFGGHTGRWSGGSGDH